MPAVLQRGDLFPHVTVRAVDGRTVRYDDLWQRRPLLLACLDREHEAYAAELAAHLGELTAHETACVITRDRVDRVPVPGVVIADRWGEIFFVGDGTAGSLPTVGALVEWLDYVAMQCPECQGETR